jgi:SAM-dependent methyltransferase
MRIFFLSRKQRADAPEPLAIASQPRKGRRRFLRTILLVGLFAAFTSPGRRLARSVARWADGHVQGFAEPESLTYAKVIAPFLGRLYRRASEDVAAEFKGFGKGKRPLIVDIGCGTGELAVAISKRLRESRIVGLDSSPSMLLWASRHETTDGRLRFLVGDGAKLPFADGSVDMVVSTLSLHHWTDPSAVMAEIDRVLRPGASALVYDLGLLTMTTEEMARVAANAGIAPHSITFDRVHGGFLSQFFVRFRFDPGR